jgi:hypothetical protein
MELTARKLTTEDWSVLENWWSKWRGWTAPSKESLPDNGTGGIMICKGDVPVVAGFVYLSNSKTVFFDWVISNPEYRDKDRKEAIKLLITSIEYVVKSAGYKYVFSITRNPHLLKVHEELNYIIDKTKSHELVKILE